MFFLLRTHTQVNILNALLKTTHKYITTLYQEEVDSDNLFNNHCTNTHSPRKIPFYHHVYPQIQVESQSSFNPYELMAQSIQTPKMFHSHGPLQVISTYHPIYRMYHPSTCPTYKQPVITHKWPVNRPGVPGPPFIPTIPTPGLPPPRCE